MTNVNKNVEINLPLENLIDTLCKLPPDTLRKSNKGLKSSSKTPSGLNSSWMTSMRTICGDWKGVEKVPTARRLRPRWRKYSESHLSSKGPWQRSCVMNEMNDNGFLFF